MIKYLTIYDEKNPFSSKVLDEDVWVPLSEEPETPYVKLEIKVLEIETRYKRDRGTERPQQDADKLMGKEKNGSLLRRLTARILHRR